MNPGRQLLQVRKVTLALAVCMIVLPGCVTFYTYRPIEVKVVDAETGRPIPKANVRIWYGDDVHLWNPPGLRATTDQDGNAELRIGARTAGFEGVAYWSVWAGDYEVIGGFAPEGRRIPDRFRQREDDIGGLALIRLFVWEHRSMKQGYTE